MKKYFCKCRFIIPLFAVLFVYNDLCHYFVKKEKLVSHFDRSQKQKPFYSSVWCRGSNHTDRICRFENICYRPVSQDFVFFKSVKSIIHGVPVNRFDPTLADISSVHDHNKMYFNYVELPDTSISKFNVTMIDSKALIVKRFNSENLMHVFHDDLLPMFHTLMERFSFHTKNDEKIILVFADERQFDPYSILYDNFLNSKPLYLSALNGSDLYCLTQGFIGLNKDTTWYQYGFREPQGFLKKDFIGMATIIQRFTSYFHTKFNITPTEDTEDYAVLLTRKQNRRILNEATVTSILNNNADMKVVIVGLETHSILDIIKIVSRCKILIGMHGALLIFSLFLKQGSVVIELFPYAIKAEYVTPYRTITSFPDLDISYHFWENNIKSNSIPHPENSPSFGGIQHLTIADQKKILETNEVMPKLCCYDPEWLYFIYQDTIVDIDSFVAVVRDVRKEIDELKKKDSRNDHRIVAALHPGEIQNLTCVSLTKQEESDNLTFELSWMPPWNLEFFSYNISEYEVWIQILGTEDVSAYLTKRLSFTITAPSNSSKFYVWVRCHTDSYIGPFSTNPSVCFSSQ